MRVWLIKGILRLFSIFPLRLTHAVATLIGKSLVYFSSTRITQVTIINVRLCFPHWSSEAQTQLVHHSLIETSKTFLELGCLWLRPAQKTLTFMRHVSGEELVQQALHAQKGVILLTPHLGAWEIAGLYAASRYQMTTLYKPPKLAGLAQLILEARQRSGGRYVATDATGIRALYRTLSQGNVVGILPDQVPTQASAGVFVPFFDIMANTMTLVSRLVKKTGAIVIFAYAERLPSGQGYHLHFLPAPDELYSDNLETSVMALNQGVEMCVQACPTQYQWSYKRFKTRPLGEMDIY